MRKKINLTVFLLFTLVAQARNIDTKHISLELSFDWEKKQAFGKAAITLTVLNETGSVLLDAAFLTIESVRMNQKQLKFTHRYGGEPGNLEILLDKTYKANEPVTLVIQYRTNYINRSDPYAPGGSFGKGLRFQQPTSATPAKRKQIWSSGEPDNNKYWFPCNEDIEDIHTTEVTATVDNPLMVISNGILAGRRKNKNNTTTFHYISGHAFPNYLVSLVVGEYTGVVSKANGTVITTYGYPHEKEAVAATVELLPDMLRFLEEKTGVDYPFQTYSQAVVQDYPFPGLVGQHATAILSDNYIDDYGVHQDYKYLWDGVAVQALANQWFGNLVMPKSWKDIWLNQAFAQYFAGLYTAECYGGAEYLLWYYPFEKSNITGDWANGNIHPIVPDSTGDVKAFTADSYSKYRGALVLRMLQAELGETDWWKAVSYFVNSNKHRQVSTADFQKAVETVTGKSWQWFFDQWVYQVGLPEFTVSKNYNPATGQLTLLVNQTQSREIKTAFKQVAFFEGRVMVEIDGRPETVYIKPQQQNQFVFDVAGKPGFLNFNAWNVFLCEVSYDAAADEYLAQMIYSKDAFAKREALNKLVAVANDSVTPAQLKDTIVRAIKGEVTSGQYWRYRWAALNGLSRISSAAQSVEMTALLKQLIKNETGWLKFAAINILGNTGDSAFLDIYLQALRDKSDRVITAAANAIGKTKSAGAFSILLQLEKQPSWKNQNRISALNGLQQLGDARAVEYALACLKDNRSPRWYLATPLWDYPFAAVNTIVSLGRADLACPVLIERLKKSLYDDDLNDIFQLVQLINLLKLESAGEMYVWLREKFKNDEPVLKAVDDYEKQYLESLKK